ncbi:MAG: hypothetical protein VB061_13085 [Christensenella sp.]|nr:hypothetical protein [Christensenella sp.]
MKQFFQKLLLLTLVCAVIAGIANLIFVSIKGGMVPTSVDRFRNAPAKIDVANLGNSHGQSAFLYNDYPELSCINLANGSQDLAQDERLLEYYIDRFTDQSVLYIPVTYPSLFGDSTSRSDFLSLNRRYYYVLPPRLILDFSWREWISVKLPGLFIPSWRATYWRHDEFVDMGEQTAYEIDVKDDALNAVERHVLAFEKDGTYKLNPKMIGYLEQIVSLCKEHSVKPVLITTPFLKEYNDQVPEAFLVVLQSFLQSFAQEQQIDYLDFSHDARFQDRYDLFLNSDHLNDTGGLYFTKLLLSGEKPVS